MKKNSSATVTLMLSLYTYVDLILSTDSYYLSQPIRDPKSWRIFMDFVGPGLLSSEHFFLATFCHPQRNPLNVQKIFQHLAELLLEITFNAVLF